MNEENANVAKPNQLPRMKPNASKAEILDRILEKAPDTYAKRREVLLNKALGRDLIYASIDEAVGVAGGIGIWNTQKLHENFYLLFHQIGTEIASTRPSPWRDSSDVVLRSLKTYVQKCIQLRKGGNQKYWREDAVLEAAPVEKRLAKAAGKTVAAIRLEIQQTEFPKGEKLMTNTADKYAKRKVREARALNRTRIVRTK